MEHASADHESLRLKVVVHSMLLRTATAGEVDVFLQMHANEIETKKSCTWHWALPHVVAEPAENMLIQTGTASERRLAARRAALRAVVLYTSAASAASLAAQCIKIKPLQHHTMEQLNLPADAAVMTFGRCPPSLVEAWYDTT